LEEFEGRSKAHDIIFEKLFDGNSGGDVIQSEDAPLRRRQALRAGG